MQTDVTVGTNTITGTLHYLSGSNAITDEWGEGNFMVLKFSNVDPRTTSIMVGLSPSEGSGLVELYGDPDMNGVFKITNKNTQKFKVISSDGNGKTATQVYDLGGLTCESST